MQPFHITKLIIMFISETVRYPGPHITQLNTAHTISPNECRSLKGLRQLWRAGVIYWV